MTDILLEPWVIDALVDDTDIYRAKKGTIRFTAYLNFECSVCKGVFRDELHKTRKDPKCVERQAIMCPYCREVTPSLDSFHGFIESLCLTRKQEFSITEHTTHFTIEIPSVNLGINYMFCKTGTEPNHNYNQLMLRKGRDYFGHFIQVYHADWSRYKTQIQNYVTNLVDGLLLEGYAKSAAKLSPKTTSVRVLSDEEFYSFVGKYATSRLRYERSLLRFGLITQSPKELAAVVQFSLCSGHKAGASRYTLEYIPNPKFDHTMMSQIIKPFLVSKGYIGTFEMFNNKELIDDYISGWETTGDVDRQYFWYNRDKDIYMSRHEAKPMNLLLKYEDLTRAAYEAKECVEKFVCTELGLYRIWRGGLSRNELRI